jgi:uncharacterized membrane protein
VETRPDAARARRNRWLHRGFAAGILLKGVFAGIEVLAGTLLLLFGRQTAAFADAASSGNIHLRSEPAAAWLAHLGAGFSAQGEHFYALFFLAHGLMKGIAVMALLRRMPHAFPFAISVLSAFVLYQLQHYLRTGSVGLLVVSAFDILIICLIIREYRPVPSDPA